MKTLLVLISTVLFTVCNAATTTMSMHFSNKYLAFGAGGELHSDPVIQAGITTTFENGVYVGIWGSCSPDGESNLGDEIDFTIGWSGEIGKGWTLGYNLTYFNEPDLVSLGAGDIVNNRLVLSRKFDEYNVAFIVRNYTPMSGSNFEGGWLIGASVSRNFQLTEKMSLHSSVELKYDDGLLGMDDGLILSPFLSLSYKLDDVVTLDILQARGFIQLTTEDKRQNDIMWSTGINYKF